MRLKNAHKYILVLATGLFAALGGTRAQALDHCAAYGPDFTSVAGSDACVRIGGRVRVEFGFRRLSNPSDENFGQVGSHPAAMRGGSVAQPDDNADSIEEGHMRLDSLSEQGRSDPYR